MKSSTLRKRLFHGACLAVMVFVLLLMAVGAVVIRSSRDAESVRAELAERCERPPLRPETERAGIIELARGMRTVPSSAMEAAATAAAAAVTPPPPPAPPSPPHDRDPMHPSWDGVFGRDPAERPLHDWLSAVRLTRIQPGPAPPPDVIALLAERAPELDALAARLSRTVLDPSAPFVAPGDRERADLEHARVLLLAAACAESLSQEGDALRGERLLEAAFTLARDLPVGIDDAGPGDLFLAVMRQAGVADARAWGHRIAELDPRARLVDALEWSAAARLARWERNASRRQEVKPGWVPALIQRLLGSIESKHDIIFTSRIAAAEAALAQDVRALDRCDDPWQLSGLDSGAMRSHWPLGAEVRLRTALASASLQQADAALTCHVLLRRHGLAAPQDACGTQPLIEVPEGGDRFLVGWRLAGRDDPGPADRERPHEPFFMSRTWPEPSLPFPTLAPFSFEAPAFAAPVTASAPAP